MDRHSIKLEDDTYKRLLKFEAKRTDFKQETANEAVKRLLDIHDGLMIMKNQILGLPENKE